MKFRRVLSGIAYRPFGKRPLLAGGLGLLWFYVSSAAAQSVSVYPSVLTQQTGTHCAFVANVTGAGNSSVTYQWFLNGQSINGATSSTLQLSDITYPGSAGTYSVQVTIGGSTTVESGFRSGLLNVSPDTFVLSQNNLIVVRLGDGAQPLSQATGNTIYLDQVMQFGEAITGQPNYLNTTMIPDQVPNGVTAPGPALLLPGLNKQGGHDGFLTLSANGYLLSLAGYDQPYPFRGADVTIGGNSFFRGIYNINQDGVATLAYMNNNIYSKGNHQIRSVVTDGNGDFWASGLVASADGIKFFNSSFPASDYASIGPSSSGSTRLAQIVNNALYYSDQNLPGIYVYGPPAPIPSDGATDSSAQPFLTTAAGGSPNDFAISPDLKTIYIADDRPYVSGTTQAGGIQRWDGDGSSGHYTFSYTLQPLSGASNGAVGLTASFPSSIVSWGAGVGGATVFATTAGASGNSLVQISDGGSGFPQVLYTVSASQTLRGVRFGPPVSSVLPVKVTWANPADIVYGTPLSGAQLNATANVAGAFSYNPPLGSVLQAGASQTLGVTFTPTDTVDYPNPVTQTVPINVDPASLTITANNQAMIIAAAYPTFTVSYSGFVNGDTSASLTTPPYVSLNAVNFNSPGTYPIVPTGAVDSDYNMTYVPGVLTISPSFSLKPTTAFEFAAPGNDSVSVTVVPSGTPWQATANASWLHFSAGSGSGAGSATVNFTFDDNSQGGPRTGTLTIAGQIFTVTQDGTTAAPGLLATLYLLNNDSDGQDAIGVIQGADGYLYAESSYGDLIAPFNGNIFRINPGGAPTDLHQFPFPQSAPEGNLLANNLTQGRDGYLYGTTQRGGATFPDGLPGAGSVFKMSTNSPYQLTVFHTFGDQLDGSGPSSPLLEGADGAFYGTCLKGGNLTRAYEEAGTVYRIGPNGDYTILHTFQGYQNQEGDSPMGTLAEGNDGNLYGITDGPSKFGGAGSVYQLTPAGVCTTLYSFTGGSDGGSPQGGLVLGSDGNFYGTTTSGGAYNDGTVFRITPTGSLTTLYSFGSVQTPTAGAADGNSPTVLVAGNDGNLYGITTSGGDEGVGGGSSGAGALFRITPAGAFKSLYSFGTSVGPNEGDAMEDGANPSSLVQGSDGNFYGTTGNANIVYGGTPYGGTIFKLSVPVPAVVSFSRLSPSQAAPAGSTVTLSGTLSGAGPIYPAQGETVTIYINGSFQTTTINDNTGDFSLAYDLSGIPASATPYTIIYSYNGDAALGSARDISTSLTVETPPSYTQLQILLPGENAAPNTPNGKTGTPLAQVQGVAFTVTVNAADNNYTVIPAATPTLLISAPNDPGFALPGNASKTVTLVNGSASFQATLNTTGGQFVAVMDERDAATAARSAEFSVNPSDLVLIAGDYEHTIWRYAADGSPSVAIPFINTPAGLAFDNAGNLYVADATTPTISQVTPSGSVSTFATIAVGADDGPEGLAFNSSGSLFTIVDQTESSRTIWQVTSDGSASQFVSLQDHFETEYQDRRLAIDSFNNIYVQSPDSPAAISKITPGGEISTFVSLPGEAFPLVFDSGGDLLVSVLTGDGVTTVYKIDANGSASQFATVPSYLQSGTFDPFGDLLVASDVPVTAVWEIASDGTLSRFPGAIVGSPDYILAALPPSITSCPASVEVSRAYGQCASALIPFNATAWGYPAPQITYALNGAPITSPYQFPVGVNGVTVTALNIAGSQTGSFTVTVDSDPPIGGPNSLAAIEGQSASVPVATVLSSASAPAGGTLSITGVASPTSAGGTVTVANGLITYTPPSASPVAGADIISYTLSDGCQSARGFIDVVIGTAAAPPIAAATAQPGQQASVNVPPGSSTGGLSATLNVTGSQPVAVSATLYPSAPVATPGFGLGATYLDLEAPNAQVGDTMTVNFYYPDTGPSSEPTLQFYTGTAWEPVFNDGNTAPVTTTVTINGILMWQLVVTFDAASQPPITSLQGTVFALVPTTAPTVTCPANIQVNQDTGQCGALVSFPAPTVTGFPSPTVVCQFNGVTITSPFEFPVGVNTVNCTASSSAGTDSSSFSVTVLNTNPPVAGVNALGAYQGEPVSVPVAKVLLKDHAPSGGPLSISAVTPGTPGGAAVTLAAGQITYTPTASFIGPDTITYTLSDGCGTAQGTIAVTVLATDLPGQNLISINNTPTSTTVVFAGIPGANYEIQYASAAEGPWSNLSGPDQAAPDGLIQYTDTTYPKPASRFYRTQYVSGP